MSERDDIEDMAGEYVLGTLDVGERTTVAARRQREPALDAAIRAWETRLAPLNAEYAEATPASDLLTRIEAAIDAQAAGSTEVGKITTLKRRVTRWRLGTIGATAVAAALAGILLIRQPAPPADPQEFVAVFHHDDTQPAFVMSINLATRQLTIRPVEAEKPTNKTYQLWIASDRLGPGPKSLGLLDASFQPTQKMLAQYDTDLLRTATFGISLEPEGGSPTGRPTGPAIHGKLIPARN